MITVEGKIKGKARPRFSTRTGHAITPQDTVNYENWVKMCYKEQHGEYLEGALQATIIAFDDDKQIIDLRVIKKFTEENERVEFEIKKITKEEQ